MNHRIVDDICLCGQTSEMDSKTKKIMLMNKKRSVEVELYYNRIESIVI
jgi:hypothetical protein